MKREDLFIVSKLWNTFHEGDKVEPICRKQLADWGIDYFDLYLVHFPIALKYVDPSVRYPPGWTSNGKDLEFSNASIQETWTAMESLVDKGLTRSIGISNFSIQLIMDLLRYARIRPATLQIEHHPYLTQPALIEYAQKEGIAVTAYSSFGPQSFLELQVKNAQETPVLFEHSTIKSIAEKHGKTPAQVLLRWATQRNIAVIPKSNNPDRLAQNLDVTGWDLEASEIEAISALDRNLRFNDPLGVRICRSDICLPMFTDLVSSTDSIVPSSPKCPLSDTTSHVNIFLTSTRTPFTCNGWTHGLLRRVSRKISDIAVIPRMYAYLSCGIDHECRMI